MHSQGATGSVAGIEEDSSVEWWQQPGVRDGAPANLVASGSDMDASGSGAKVEDTATLGTAQPTHPDVAGDYTPAELPRRYAFVYGDEDAYRAILHQTVPLAEDARSAGDRKSFACWSATVEGVGGHIFALTTAQYRLLDQHFPSHVARSSVLANIGQGPCGNQGRSGAPRQPLACSTWLDAPFLAGDTGTGTSDADAKAAAHQTGIDGPAPGSKRSLFVTSIGSETDVDLGQQQANNLQGASNCNEPPNTTASSNQHESFGSDLRLSFGSDWRSSLPDLDLLPDMQGQPVPSSAGESPVTTILAADTQNDSTDRKPPKQRSHATKMKKTQGQNERPSVVKGAAAEAQYVLDVQKVEILPRGPDGRPKPSSPWIAAAVYWAASSDHALLTRATGISVAKPAGISPMLSGTDTSCRVSMDTPAEFRIVTLGHPTKQAFGREAEIDSGVALVGQTLPALAQQHFTNLR